jgi:hypothetical protein
MMWIPRLISLLLFTDRHGINDSGRKDNTVVFGIFPDFVWVISHFVWDISQKWEN